VPLVPPLVAGPTRTAAWALLAGAAALLVVGLVADAGGRLLALPAAVLLAGLAARDLALRPVLRADAAGLDVVVGLRRRRVDWAQVERLRVVQDRRTPVLEIDLGATLVLLTRGRLGRSPALVLQELRDVRGC
jgi:hypothetical protein